jgi:uncharacterized protein
VKQAPVAVLSGALFAAGLALSGMTDPSKVLGFLDVAGAWDPSLAFVMGGAVGFHALWLRMAASRPPAGASVPPSTGVDARLVAGAALFGVGWGLSGYCPGPGLVALAFGRVEGAVFVGAMLVGVALFQLPRRLSRS